MIAETIAEIDCSLVYAGSILLVTHSDGGKTCGGALYFIDLLLFHPPRAKISAVVIATAGVATFLGLYWLWVDFINPDPRPEQ